MGLMFDMCHGRYHTVAWLTLTCCSCYVKSTTIEEEETVVGEEEEVDVVEEGK